MADLYIDVNMPGDAGQEAGEPMGLPIEDEDRAKEQKQHDEDMKLLAMEQVDMLKTLLTTLGLSQEYIEQVVTQTKEQYELQKNALKGPEGKKQNKIREYMGKKMVAADFFTTAGAWMKNFGKMILGLGVSILTGLLAFAMLGPDMLEGIISYVVESLGMIAGAIIKALPVVFAALVKWLPIVLKALVDVAGTLVTTLIKAIFGVSIESSGLKTFLGILFLIGAVLMKLGLFMPMLKLLATTVLPALVTAIGWPIIAIVALIAALIALYVYAEEIEKFFDGLIEQFKNMSTGMKILVIAMALLMFPLTFLVTIVYSLVKLFSLLKRSVAEAGGWGKVFEKLWGAIKKAVQMFIGANLMLFQMIVNAHVQAFRLITSIPGKIKKVFMRVIDAVVQFGKDLLAKFFELITRVTDFLKPETLLKSIKEGFKTAMDGIFGAGTFNGIKAQFDTAVEYIKTLFKSVLDYIGATIDTVIYMLSRPDRLTKGTEAFESSLKLRQLGAKDYTNSDIDKVISANNKSIANAKTDISQIEGAETRKILQQIADSNDKNTKLSEAIKDGVNKKQIANKIVQPSTSPAGTGGRQ